MLHRPHSISSAANVITPSFRLHPCHPVVGVRARRGFRACGMLIRRPPRFDLAPQTGAHNCLPGASLDLLRSCTTSRPANLTLLHCRSLFLFVARSKNGQAGTKLHNQPRATPKLGRVQEQESVPELVKRRTVVDVAVDFPMFYSLILLGSPSPFYRTNAASADRISRQLARCNCYMLLVRLNHCGRTDLELSNRSTVGRQKLVTTRSVFPAGSSMQGMRSFVKSGNRINHLVL